MSSPVKQTSKPFRKIVKVNGHLVETEEVGGVISSLGANRADLLDGTATT
jgi:hypothetical protein